MGVVSNNNEKTILVTAPAKLLLFGEYLALFNYPAVGIPISLYTQAKFIPSASILLTTQPKDTSNEVTQILQIISKIPIYDDFYRHLAQVCNLFNIRVPHGTIYIESTLPIASGLGSSASFCVCIAKILIQYNSIDYSTSENELLNIWKLAHNLEQFFHGKASGIDTAIITYNNTLLLEPSATAPYFSPIPLSFNFKDYLVFGYTPRDRINTSTANTISSSTKLISKYIEENNATTKKWVHTHMQAVNKINAYKNLHEHRENFLLAIAEYCSTIHSQIDFLHMSHPTINSILKESNNIGGLGGKISGSGFGGAFFLLCNNTKNRLTLKREIKLFCKRNKLNAILY